MKPKILLISNMYPTRKYPAYGIFVRQFVQKMSDYFRFEKVVIRGRQESRLRKLGAYVRFAADIARHMRKDTYDYLYIHYIGNTGTIVYFLLPFLKGRLVLNFHGSDLLGDFSVMERLMFFFSRRLAAKADMIVVPSEFFGQKALQRLGIDAGKIFVYPSGGVDMSHFSPLDKTEAKTYFGYRHDDFVVGMVSSIYEKKGWRTFLEAVKMLRGKIDNLKVLVAGYGIEKAQFMQEVEQNHLEEIVTYLGEQSHQELVRLYSALDIFVFPTLLEESLGLVGLEAMACSVPVAGSDIGALADYIRPGYNGYLFPPGDAKALAQTLHTHYLKMPSDMSQNALKTAQLYESRKVALALADALKQQRNNHAK